MSQTRFWAGVDVGSCTTKVVLLDSSGHQRGWALVPTGVQSTQAAEQALRQALISALSQDPDSPQAHLEQTVATGYGRRAVPWAQRCVTEISCNGRGVHHLFADARTVIDIGGQDAKVIRLDPGGVAVDFAMNDKCAAGTGRFLEVMAGRLQVPLSQLSQLAATAAHQATISNVCTVFAESEVVSLVARNQPQSSIAAGVLQAVVDRVWALAQTVGVQGPVVMAGGVALNRGVVLRLQARWGNAVQVPPQPQLVGALGAALLAAGAVGSGSGAVGR